MLLKSSALHWKETRGLRGSLEVEMLWTNVHNKECSQQGMSTSTPVPKRALLLARIAES